MEASEESKLKFIDYIMSNCYHWKESIETVPTMFQGSFRIKVYSSNNIKGIIIRCRYGEPLEISFSYRESIVIKRDNADKPVEIVLKKLEKFIESTRKHYEESLVLNDIIEANGWYNE